MSEVLIAVARTRRLAALDTLEKRRTNVFTVSGSRQPSKPLFIHG